MTEIELYTDGSTSPANPGDGGVGCVMVHRGEKTTVRTFGMYLKPNVTNNWVEAQAVAQGLRQLTKPCKVVLYTDSQYVIHGMKRIFTGMKLLETNEDAWQAIVNTLKSKPHKVIIKKLDAHRPSKYSDHNKLNNLADKLAGFSAKTKSRWDRRYESVEDAYADRPTRKDIDQWNSGTL